MIKYYNILFFASVFVISHGQQIDPQKIELTDAARQLELIREETNSLQKLIIRNTFGETVKSIDLPEEFDPYRFDDVCTGKRSFVVISGRYKFFIFITGSEKIIGPVSYKPRGDAEDAQSGVWHAFKIIHEGQYLLASALDFGLYCFDLRDLCHPVEVDYIKADSIFFKGNYAFLDLISDNIYNLITASCGNYNNTITTGLILTGYKFQQDPAGKPDYKITDKRYLSLVHIKPDTSVEDLTIDMETGKLK